MKPRILIIGSSGMLGRDLCQNLSRCYEVIGADVVHNPQSIVHRFYRIDITKKKDTVDFVKKIHPDIVIHAAAYTDVDGCELHPKKAYKVNTEGTKNVALACKAAGTILIYISTDFVFDGKKRKSYKETDRTNPLGIYAKSKLKGEETIKKILKKYFILRTGWLYGKNGKNFVDTILKLAKKEKCLRVVDDQKGSPTYAKDLAKAIHVLIARIIKQTRPVHRPGLETAFGVYHVSNADATSWYDYAKEILRLAKIKALVIPISSKELARHAKRPAMSILDNSKFRKYTGYKMRNWREALKEYVQ